jgi:hypothetical protein
VEEGWLPVEPGLIGEDPSALIQAEVLKLEGSFFNVTSVHYERLTGKESV